MPALSLQHVTKTFRGGVRAVDDLTLEAAEGELLVLVGPSGCGKTTILRLIAGLESPDAGEISIGDRAAHRLPPKDRDVAMVFQHGTLYPHLSVHANLAFGLKLRGAPAAEIARRVCEAAELLGIADLLGRRPGELSGGQQQRVSLGRAIVRQPRLFLFDEPLSDLDAALRTQMRQEIRRLHARLGTTMIYVTHEQTEAMTLGQRVAALCHGRLQQVADPMTLYRRPVNRFVAGLIGSPGMNFIAGRIEQRGDELVFDGGREAVERGACPPLPVPGSRRSAIEAYVGRAVVLGLRPEHFELAASPTADGPQIRATVEAVERLGPESHVRLSAAGMTLVWRVEGNPALDLGATVHLFPQMAEAHFFDPVTDAAIA